MHDGHNFEHEHPHLHTHGNCRRADSKTSEESKALLEYMLKHNRSHTDELNSLAHRLGGDAAELIYKARMSYETGNENLEQALNFLNKGE